MMNIQQIEALVDDRKVLLEGLDHIMDIAREDYGITRTALMNMQKSLVETLKKLSYDRSIQNIVPANE